MTTKQQEHARIWESYIRKECNDLEAAELAWVDKNHEAPTVPGEDIPREPSKPDFSGWLEGGRHVVFEAKATLSDTSFDFHKLAEHQWEHLGAAHRHGAVSFVYILDGRRRKWVVPWEAILEYDETRSSYPFDDVRVHEKRDGETWLDTLERLGEVG